MRKGEDHFGGPCLLIWVVVSEYRPLADKEEAMHNALVWLARIIWTSTTHSTGCRSSPDFCQAHSGSTPLGLRFRQGSSAASTAGLVASKRCRTDLRIREPGTQRFIPSGFHPRLCPVRASWPCENSSGRPHV